MWQDSLWGWRLSCRYKNYDYVQVLKYHVLLKYKFFYWFFRWFIFRWSEVPQEVFEMRELQKEAGLELCCHHGPEVVLHCMHEKEQVAGGAQNPPRHQGYRSSRWKGLPKVPCHHIRVKKIRNFLRPTCSEVFRNQVVNPVCSELVRMVRKFLYKVISWQTSYLEPV